MFCKECGTENEDNRLNCTNCSAFLKSNKSPLSGGDRIKFVSFFLFLGATLFFGIVPMLIALAGIYVMKKNKDFSPIQKSKKYIHIYLVILALGGAIVTAFAYYDNNNYYRDSYYDKIDGKTVVKYYPEEQKIEFFNNLKNDTVIVAGASLIIMPMSAFLIMSLLNMLYFKPLEKHQDWILINGIFADKVKKEKHDNTTGIIGRDKLSSFSIADELIKWNDLFEKDLVSKDEFENAKQKLLNQE